MVCFDLQALTLYNCSWYVINGIDELYIVGLILSYFKGYKVKDAFQVTLYHLIRFQFFCSITSKLTNSNTLLKVKTLILKVNHSQRLR